MSEAWNVSQGKDFSPLAFFTSIAGGSLYGSLGGSFEVAEKIIPGALRGHAEHLKHATSAMGKFTVKGLKTFG